LGVMASPGVHRSGDGDKVRRRPEHGFDNVDVLGTISERALRGSVPESPGSKTTRVACQMGGLGHGGELVGGEALLP